MCTSNLIDPISPPLLDRLEVIKIAGYITEEKVKIAENYLIPRAFDDSGLKEYVKENK